MYPCVESVMLLITRVRMYSQRQKKSHKRVFYVILSGKFKNLWKLLFSADPFILQYIDKNSQFCHFLYIYFIHKNSKVCQFLCRDFDFCLYYILWTKIPYFFIYCTIEILIFVNISKNSYNRYQDNRVNLRELADTIKPAEND